MNALLLLAMLAFAQDGTPPAAQEMDYPGGQPNAQQDSGGGGTGEAYKPPTLADAKANFATVIESFLSQNTKEGIYQLRDKKAKRVRRLAYQSVDEKSIRPAGDGKFSGLVRFKEAVTDLSVALEMTVDMSSPQWRVAGAKMRRQK